MKIAVIGATGMVGTVMLSLLETRNFHRIIFFKGTLLYKNSQVFKLKKQHVKTPYGLVITRLTR